MVDADAAGAPELVASELEAAPVAWFRPGPRR
jgi:hypothetical protein